jgi:CMP-N-acetylneuraminic acid synthetase
MKYILVIPARSNSKRLPGKNMKILGDKPLIQYSIDFAKQNFDKEMIWVNSDCPIILNFAQSLGVNTMKRPKQLAKDTTSTVEVLINQIEHFKKCNIECDAIILLQPTNPFRENDLLSRAIEKFQISKRNSLATFSISEKKMGIIENNLFYPKNYTPGQRSQDIQKSYFENGLLYITKSTSILKGNIITEDVFPLICDTIESSIDIDYMEDFIFAESILISKKHA